MRLDRFNIPVPAIKTLWSGVIYKGKHNPEFMKAGDGPKYTDPDYDQTGSINLVDAYILYNLVNSIQPKNVCEVGSWFGTSAAIMAAESHVFTCDKHDYIVKSLFDDWPIDYYNMVSNEFFQVMIDEGWKFDFAFIDGSLNKLSARRMLKCMNRKIIAIHDFVGVEKGVRTYKMLKTLFKGKLIKPANGSTIALYYKEGDFNV